jgi:hypothetical protein
MEKAPPISGYDSLHIRKRVQLPVRHGDRYLGGLHREEPPKPTTFLIHLPWDYLGACGLEKPHGLLFHPEFSERVATVMVGDPTPIQTTPEFGDLEDVHEELGQFVGALSQCGRLEEARVVAAQHRGAASGGEDHIIRFGENCGGVSSHFASLRHVARVPRRLAAAHLIAREVDLDVQRAEEANGVCSRVREKAVTEAGDEE